MLDWTCMPPHENCAEGLRMYIEKGIPSGSFLEAILCNDLKEACARADNENRFLIWHWVNWLYNEAPSDCWGSPEKYQAWIGVRGLEGMRPKAVHRG